MNVIRPIVSVVTALAFFVQTTGLAYAQDAQPVPYAPSQPVPLPAAPPSPPTQSSAPAQAAQPSLVPAPPTAPPPPPPAYAPPPAGYSPGYTQAPAARPTTGDTIYLKDGGLMRGTLVEMLPNDHATIQLATGQTATIEWGRIDHIERGALQGPPMAPLALPPPRTRLHRPAGIAGAEPTAVVHLDADPDVALQSVSPGTGRWATVCAGPCDAPVPIDREYRVAGPGIRSSRPFRIHAAPGQHVTITVNAASAAARSAGVALSSIGSAAIIIGVIVLVYGALGACEQTDAFGDCLQTQPDGGVETAGAIIALAGAAVLVGGVILYLNNARTTTTESVPAALAPPARPETSWLRTPVWHDSARESSVASKPMGFPLLSRSF
jgi:hypothetical protein